MKWRESSRLERRPRARVEGPLRFGVFYAEFAESPPVGVLFLVQRLRVVPPPSADQETETREPCTITVSRIVRTVPAYYGRCADVASVSVVSEPIIGARVGPVYGICPTLAMVANPYLGQTGLQV